MDEVLWSQLPPELFVLIAEKLTIYSDYVRLRAVCVNWRSWLPSVPNHLPCQPPWLMLPPNNNRNYRHQRGFFDLTHNKVLFLNLPEYCRHRRICSSSHGWLILLDESSEILCLNPLSKARVRLPPLSSFPNVTNFNVNDVGREYSVRASPIGNFDAAADYTYSLKLMRDTFIRKIVLSASPGNGGGDFVAFAILNCGDELGFCKRGDDCWKIVPGARYFSEDVIYVQGLFYGVNKLGHVAVIDVEDTASRVKIIETQMVDGGDMMYLVNNGDELLLVCRFLDPEYEYDVVELYTTTWFEVYKLDEGGSRWKMVINLEDRIIFLGKNSSLLLSASDVPGCQGNCIFFTDDHSDLPYNSGGVYCDMGFFNLKDGSIEPLPCYPDTSKLLQRWPPIWVTPNPL